jgi:hypothetical protein
VSAGGLGNRESAGARAGAGDAGARAGGSRARGGRGTASSLAGRAVGVGRGALFWLRFWNRVGCSEVENASYKTISINRSRLCSRSPRAKVPVCPHGRHMDVIRICGNALRNDCLGSGGKGGWESNGGSLLCTPYIFLRSLMLLRKKV